MRFVHTFWTKPLLQNKFDVKNNSLRYTLTDYACSAAWIHRCGYQIVLYTDEFGADLFDFIPYDEVVIIDEDKINDSSHFAAKFKFEAMKEMELGDVLIDGDLIIRSRKTCKMIEENTNDALYSFFEPHSYTSGKINNYIDMIGKLNCFNFEDPYHLPSLSDLSWPNTSMLRITNQELKDEYIRQYEYHMQMLQSTDFGRNWPDIIIEQYFLWCLCEGKNYKHEPFVYGFPTPEANDKAINLKFTHLGTCKVSHNDVVDAWLKEANPVLHKRTHNEINRRIREMC